MTTREELVKELNKLPVISYATYPDEWGLEIIADFIISDRKRIVEPLVKFKKYRYNRGSNVNSAIDEILKNAGIEQSKD